MTRKRKSTVSSIRIPTDISEIIRKDAERNRMSFNALTLRILTRYSEWDRFTQKLGFVNVPREMLRALLEAANQETLNAIAKGTASSYKESILLWFKEINLTTFLEFLKIGSYYTGLFEYDLKEDGKNFTITVHHQLGEKWSKAYEHFVSEAFGMCLGVAPVVETGKGHAVVKFTMP